LIGRWLVCFGLDDLPSLSCIKKVAKATFVFLLFLAA
jgi:hypothetical protein